MQTHIRKYLNLNTGETDFFLILLMKLPLSEPKPAFIRITYSTILTPTISPRKLQLIDALDPAPGLEEQYLGHLLPVAEYL